MTWASCPESSEPSRAGQAAEWPQALQLLDQADQDRKNLRVAPGNLVRRKTPGLCIHSDK